MNKIACYAATFAMQASNNSEGAGRSAAGPIRNGRRNDSSSLVKSLSIAAPLWSMFPSATAKVASFVNTDIPSEVVLGLKFAWMSGYDRT